MYICPTCGEKFVDKEKIAKHSLRCWKEHNPNHVSTPAPRSEDVVTREVNSEIIDFFASLQKGKINVGSNA